MPSGDVLKLANVIGDETRYAIYRHLLADQRDRFTVQQVADAFSIHPNVARMHLEKLVDAGLLEAGLKRSGPAGGRPARSYSLADRAVGFHFPPRDFRLLAQISLQALNSTGEVGAQALAATAREYGASAARRHLARRGLDPSSSPTDSLIAGFRELVEGQNLHPVTLEDQQGLTLSIRYCIFKEAALECPDLVCGLHRSLLHGAIEAFFGPVPVKEEGCMAGGSDACSYFIHFFPQDSR